MRPGAGVAGIDGGIRRGRGEKTDSKAQERWEKRLKKMEVEDEMR